MTRLAIIVVQPAMLAEVAGLISDHGLDIECTLDGYKTLTGRERVLVMTGDVLPPECETIDPPRVVILHVTTEAYGSQRMRRISKIEVDQFATEDFARQRGLT